MTPSDYTTAGLPNYNIPPIGPDGRWTREWWLFWVAIFNRTGGAGTAIDNTTIVEMLSSTDAPIDPNVQQAQRSIEELWSQLPLAPNLSDIGARLDVLEGLIQASPDFALVLRRVEEVESQLIEPKAAAASVLEQWNAPTLGNSWVNAGGSLNPAGYWKDPIGIVHVRGVIASGTINSMAFTLPVGYRPANTERLVAISNDAIGRLEISNAGAVTPVIGSNVYFSLDGMTFRAAQ